LAWVGRWLSRSLRSLLKKEKKHKKSARNREKLEITSFQKNGAKVVFFVWGLMIHNCTIKTRMIYFGVAEVIFQV